MNFYLRQFLRWWYCQGNPLIDTWHDVEFTNNFSVRYLWDPFTSNDGPPPSNTFVDFKLDDPIDANEPTWKTRRL